MIVLDQPSGISGTFSDVSRLLAPFADETKYRIFEDQAMTGAAFRFLLTGFHFSERSFYLSLKICVRFVLFLDFLQQLFLHRVRHPFQAILRLTLLGLVCGQTTMAHIALFARMHWPVLKEPLGFLREHPPHATTISRTLAGVPCEQLQGALTGWVARVVADQELDASVDGKWAKQSEDAQGNPLVMVNVLAHDLKLCLAQWPASEKRYEPGVLR